MYFLGTKNHTSTSTDSSSIRSRTQLIHPKIIKFRVLLGCFPAEYQRKPHSREGSVLDQNFQTLTASLECRKFFCFLYFFSVKFLYDSYEILAFQTDPNFLIINLQSNSSNPTKLLSLLLKLLVVLGLLALLNITCCYVRRCIVTCNVHRKIKRACYFLNFLRAFD